MLKQTDKQHGLNKLYMDTRLNLIKVFTSTFKINILLRIDQFKKNSFYVFLFIYVSVYSFKIKVVI